MSESRVTRMEGREALLFEFDGMAFGLDIADILRLADCPVIGNPEGRLPLVARRIIKREGALVVYALSVRPRQDLESMYTMVGIATQPDCLSAAVIRWGAFENPQRVDGATGWLSSALSQTSWSLDNLPTVAYGGERADCERNVGCPSCGALSGACCERGEDRVPCRPHFARMTKWFTRIAELGPSPYGKGSADIYGRRLIQIIDASVTS